MYHEGTYRESTLVSEPGLDDAPYGMDNRSKATFLALYDKRTLGHKMERRHVRISLCDMLCSQVQKDHLVWLAISEIADETSSIGAFGDFICASWQPQHLFPKEISCRDVEPEYALLEEAAIKIEPVRRF